MQNPLQNMLRPIYKIERSMTFMEHLKANFAQFSCIISNLQFLERRQLHLTQFWDFHEFLLFLKILSLKPFDNLWSNPYIEFLVITISGDNFLLLPISLKIHGNSKMYFSSALLSCLWHLVPNLNLTIKCEIILSEKCKA